MDATSVPLIPWRAETLEVLRLVNDANPLLMIAGDADGFGDRWAFRGELIQPAIATFLIRFGYLQEIGRTDFGARKFVLTERGNSFRSEGLQWWASLSFLQRLKVVVLG